MQCYEYNWFDVEMHMSFKSKFAFLYVKQQQT